MKKSTLLVSIALMGGMLSSSAMAGVAVGVRAGTFGFGADFDVGLTESLNLRLGYNTFSYSRTLEDTDVTYDGKLKIGAASAIFDWHAFNGGFRFSAGAVEKGPKIEVTGQPTAGTYEIDGTIYTAAEVGNLSGTIKMGDSIAPYVGIGWGNTVDTEDRVTFLLDIGAVHTGSPKATLNVTCGPSVPTIRCNQLRNDVNDEKADLEEEAKDYEWYPVVSLGFAIRF